jgi:uncharacterized membrane protein
MADEEHQNGHGGMAQRGVTRPMAEAQHHNGEGENDGGHGPPYSERRFQMLRMHHRQTLWIYWSIILLGVWTALAPFTFGYLNPAHWVDPSGGRGVWFSEQTHTALRAWLMTWSDVASGLLLIGFGWRALTPNRPVSLWACCFVGVWLTFAPVVFWAPTAAAYASGTLVGLLVIGLTILIPGMPNMILYMKMGPPVPSGWTYNPSSWPQRWIMIVLGFLGLVASRYLGVFQLGYIQSVWDPFFGSSSERVLNSDMSHMWPISDGALGALAYTFEFLMGWMGSPKRWRTMPWMVTFFGILVIPLGLVHIALVISQPVVVGYWCTFCLAAAAIMLPMIPLEIDEVVAMGQHLVQARRKGTSLWEAFWKGGPADEDATPDERSPALVSLPDQPGHVFQASIWGMSFPWTLVVSTGLGILLMAMPGTLGLEKPVATVFHLGGSLVVVTSVICMGEVVRAGRYLNVVLGLGITALPWFLGGGTLAAQLIALVAGLAVAGLAFPRGPKTENYGLWDRYVW